MARWVWNQCVATDRQMRAAGEQSLTGYEMSKRLTMWRGANVWLSEGSQVAQQYAVLDWAKARRASLLVASRRPPRFVSKRSAKASLEYGRNGFRLKDGRLHLANKIILSVVWSRPLPAEPSSVRVYRDACGDWWASFVVRREPEQFPDVGAGIGIDWGVKAIATTTDQTFDLAHPEHGRKAQAKLAHYDRMMARRKPKPGKPGSKGYTEAKKKRAKQYRKIARQRQDTARKWARCVVEHHDKIAVEDFKPKFMAKNRGLSRKAQDAAIGVAKRMLLEYATRAGRTVVLVPAAYTTMTCSCCGARAKRLSLEQRTFSCPSCGYAEDRDRNAARTILAAAEFNDACVESVSHGSPPGGLAA